MEEKNHKLTKLKQKLVMNKNEIIRSRHHQAKYDCQNLNRLINYQKNRKLNISNKLTLKRLSN